MIIGLTGGIATGKSTVSAMLKKEGIPIIDADIVAREVVELGSNAYHQIVDHFGLSILKQDGTINREKLGNIVFEKKHERNILNNIVHPAVREEMSRQAHFYKNEGHQLIVMDIPLLVENDLFHMVDEVVLVYVPESIQLKRLRARNDYTEQEAKQRMDSQLSIEKKKQYASYIIDNSGTVIETKQQVVELINKLK
ncbi:dephospho-CoA kinase [Salipaludibacillus daqingensis]|uniref:dephospho-CoA kinase n=1 Tax=Salipaludibacillus daqingensis TaxID=3041001 RepID=UPI0024750ABC|nr:dephospho-CoA kinase [Salipaludibacillus daqingensis]